MVERREGKAATTDRGGGGTKLVRRLAADARCRLKGSQRKALSSLVWVCVWDGGDGGLGCEVCRSEVSVWTNG